MTVQVSVTVWTILCFLALMLILDRLLFRPLLSFMDKRQEKLDRAREEKASALREREDTLHRREEDRIAAEKQAMQEASAALDRRQAENARLLAGKKADNERRLAALDAALAEESQRILAEAETRTDSIAAAFADRLCRASEGPTREG